MRLVASQPIWMKPKATSSPLPPNCVTAEPQLEREQQSDRHERNPLRLSPEPIEARALAVIPGHELDEALFQRTLAAVSAATQLVEAPLGDQPTMVDHADVGAEPLHHLEHVR